MGTKIEKTDLARDALYEKVNQIADEKVSLEGNETITGAKTFTSNVKLSKTSPLVDLYNTNITKGTIPSTLQYARNAMVDKDGKFIAMAQYQYNTAGETSAGIRAYNPNNETDYAQISIYYPPSGAAYTYAPTPATTTETGHNRIATTGWVNSVGNNVVHKTGIETITGEKKFTENLIRMNTNITKGTNPSSKAYVTIEFTDKNGVGTKNRVGVLESAINTNGNIETFIGAYKYENDSTTVEKISVIYPKTGNPYTYAPRPTDTTTSSGTQIATTGWVNSGSNNVVHKSADETIGGIKTFVADPYIKNPTPQLYIDDTQQIKGTAPSADIWSAINFRDANGNLMGRCRQLYNSSKTNTVALQVHKANSSSDTASASLGISYPASGDPYASAPTPPVSDNSTKIATTAYINTKFKKVSTLPASPDANTFYFIPE